MIALYMILIVTGVLLAFVILSFLGPEQSDKPFWQAVQRIRAVVDKISYYAICTICVGMLVSVGWAVLESLIDSYKETGSLTGLVVSIAIVALIGVLAAVCIKSLMRDRKEGILCECTGDCSKCKIQCRTNPNYYGIQKKGE